MGVEKIGATCSRCGIGRYWPTGRRGKVEKPETGETQDYIELECDHCGAKHHQLVFGERVTLKEEFEVTKR